MQPPALSPTRRLQALPLERRAPLLLRQAALVVSLMEVLEPQVEVSFAVPLSGVALQRTFLLVHPLMSG